jgi:hypothetical protein
MRKEPNLFTIDQFCGSHKPEVLLWPNLIWHFGVLSLDANNHRRPYPGIAPGQRPSRTIPVIANVTFSDNSRLNSAAITRFTDFMMALGIEPSFGNVSAQ